MRRVIVLVCAVLITSTGFTLLGQFDEDDNETMRSFQALPALGFDAALIINPANFKLFVLETLAEIEEMSSPEMVQGIRFTALSFINSVDQIVVLLDVESISNADFINSICLYARLNMSQQERVSLVDSIFTESESTQLQDFESRIITMAGANMAIAFAHDGLIAGKPEVVQEALRALSDPEKRMTSNPDFTSAVMNLPESYGLGLVALGNPARFQELAARDDLGLKMLLRLTAPDVFEHCTNFSGTVDFKKGIVIEGALEFAGEEHAREYAGILEKEFQEGMQMIDVSKIADLLPFPPGKLQTFIDSYHYDVSSEQNIVYNRQSFGDNFPLREIAKALIIPSVLNAGDRARQTTTVAHLEKLGQSVEQYIMDHNRIGAPKVTDIRELFAIFEATEISIDPKAIRDGWGNLLVYEPEQVKGSKTYRIVSFGKDGQPGPTPVSEGIVKRFVEDIIYSNGRFIQRPLGAQQ